MIFNHLQLCKVGEKSVSNKCFSKNGLLIINDLRVCFLGSQIQ